MNRLKRLLCFTFLMVFMAVPAAYPASSSSAESEEGIVVGRISYLDGRLLRYVPEEQDWVVTVKDAPFGLDDALYSDEDGKAELIMPNDTWIRIGGSTQIQLLVLKDDVTEVDMASGVARFYNRSEGALLRATTPFGFVTAEPGASFDLYVGDKSLEVIALKGRVSYVQDSDKKRYDVVAGSSSIVADTRYVSNGEGNLDSDWDDWNITRNQFWAKSLEVKGESVTYLPRQLRTEASSLEQNGRWEKVTYEGETRTLWRPERVSADWAPFTAGRWTVYHGDNCWVPDEPFGYVTHHYGNWVRVSDRWYWAPP
ncbi:MAG: DUF6600 domain-containing protein, partial [Acidobacteriota bacterium]